MIENKIYPTCSEEYFLVSTFPLSLGIAPITFFQLLLTSNIEESLNLTVIGMLRISVAEFILHSTESQLDTCVCHSMFTKWRKQL